MLDWISFRCDVDVQEVGSTGEAAHKFSYSSYCDFGEVKDRHHLNEENRKMFLKHHFIPAPKYRFPRHYDEKSGKSRSFQAEWLDQFHWLVYSKSSDGGFCMPCVLFATRALDAL